MAFVVWVGACSAAAPDSDWRNPADVDHQVDVDIDAGLLPDATGETAPWKSGPGAEAIVGPVIKVATYNQYLLFDTVCDSGRCGPDDFETQWTQDQFDARIAERAAAIDALDADIVFLQEIETQEVLDDLNAALQNPFPISILAETGYDASLDTAILARGELVATREYHKLNDGWQKFARKFLRVDLDIQGKRVIAFSAHFKAKYKDDEARRIAEGETAHEIVTQVAASHDGALVIMGGDLNDTPDSEPLIALTKDKKLRRVTEGESLFDIYTFGYQQRRQAIDHLLIAPTRGGRYVNKSAHSIHDNPPIPGYGGSDHSVLVGQFEMR